MGNCFKKGEKDPRPWATSRKARYAIDNSSNRKGNNSMAPIFEFDEDFDPEMAEL